MRVPTSDRDPVERLAEEFVERYRRGERPALTEYTNRYPELAEEIRQVFPTLVAVEQFGSVAAPPTGPFSAPALDGRIPSQLGEYHLLREVGRGGMGIVYEAVQESLGRRVALKVLPFHSLANATYLERFRREARAAARLHHTNIVPVFGVGEDAGTHFYAMQFIQGQGLDVVLRDVKRLRGRRDLPSASIAASLLTGQFRIGADHASADALGAKGRDELPPLAIGKPGGQGAGSGEDQTNGASGTLPEASYYRSVARIGLQVAEALAYAHRNGILHRDIKPSNLLLDLQGTVWITDFGLAKADDNDELTHTGDLVGTVRYMAPERFLGQDDPRSDIYSLGLTLYEMLTLSPAFIASSRGKLIDQIRNAMPLRPRAHDRHVPRDLETILMTAIAKDPADRYASAEAMANDLQRFLSDRPIQARRSYLLEQGWRWCRRNPAWASLLGAAVVLVLLSAIAAGLRAERNQALANQERAEEAEREVGKARDQATAARHLAQARAYRYSGRPGQRFKAMEELESAARYGPSLELRNEVIACLALTDIRLSKAWDGIPTGTKMWQIDEQYEHYARSDRQGNISIRRVAEDREYRTLPGCGHYAYHLQFSPDGRYLVGLHDGWYSRLWDVTAGRELRRLYQPGYTAFSPDGRRLASRTSDHKSLSIRDTATGRVEKTFPFPNGGWGVGFDPKGERLAAVCGTPPYGIHIWNLRDGQETHIAHASALGNIAWRPDGNFVASCSPEYGGSVYVWDARTGREKAILRGHYGAVCGISFSHDGNLLVSVGNDSTLRLWDSMSGKLLLSMTDGWNYGAPYPHFSGDDRLLTAPTGAQTGLWEVASGLTACRPLMSVAGREDTFWTVDFSPDGRWLATTGSLGTHLWDWAARREVTFLPGQDMDHAVFNPSDGSLFTGGRKGLRCWPIRADPDSPDGLRIGPSRLIGEPQLVTAASPSLDGRRIVVAAGKWRALVLSTEEKAKPVRLGEQPNLFRVALSPNGRWAATSAFQSRREKNTKVWDARTGQLVRAFSAAEVNGDACVYFSSDGRWLATVNASEYRLWRVGSWELGLRLPKRQASNSALAFARDGSVLAVVDTSQRVLLLDPESGVELASLPIPEGLHVFSLCFSPDGSQLACGASHKTALIWDLRYLRRELARLNLDWDRPPGS